MNRDKIFNDATGIKNTPNQQSAERTMFIDANIAFTDGTIEADQSTAKTIPNLYEAVKYAVDGVHALSSIPVFSELEEKVAVMGDDTITLAPGKKSDSDVVAADLTKSLVIDAAKVTITPSMEIEKGLTVNGDFTAKHISSTDDSVSIGTTSKHTIISGDDITFKYKGTDIDFSYIIDAIKELNYRTAYVDSDYRLKNTE